MLLLLYFNQVIIDSGVLCQGVSAEFSAVASG